MSGEYHMIVRGKDWYCNIPVTRTERTGDIVEAYYGDLFVGMFDLAAVNVLYITGWERLEQMRGGGER